MPTTDRRQFLSRLALVALAPTAGAILSGCPAPPEREGNGPSSPAPDGGKSSGDKKLKFGLVTDVGGVNDRSFNTLAWEGLQKAGKELGADVKYAESKQNADYGANLSRYAQGGYDLVVAVGFLMQDAFKEAATKFPNVKFVIIDGDAPPLPNTVAYKFREEEGSFLAGALAGGMTKSNVVGFVGGMEMPLIQKFEAGYKAGVQTTNPKATVKVGYAGKFDDPQRGQEIALSQMGATADILFHAAGATGVGVIKAVQNKGTGFYAIGVDKDQDGDAPGRVLTSMIKRVDVAVETVCKAVAGGTFKAGTVELGLKEDGVGLSPMQYTKKDVPDVVMKRVDALRADIIAGKIKPPKTLDELKAFKVPSSA